MTTIQTRFGEVHTTAPETLLRRMPEPSLRTGDEVYHAHFGGGKVLDVENDIVLVDFVKGGRKRLRANFLQLAA